MVKICIKNHLLYSERAVGLWTAGTLYTFKHSKLIETKPTSLKFNGQRLDDFIYFPTEYHLSIKYPDQCQQLLY